MWPPAALEDVEAAIELAATDPNGGALTIYAVVTPPAHGTVVAVVGRTAPVPARPNYHGSDSFTFRASDGGSAVERRDRVGHGARGERPADRRRRRRARRDRRACRWSTCSPTTRPGPPTRPVRASPSARSALRRTERRRTRRGGVLYTPSPTDNGARRVHLHASATTGEQRGCRTRAARPAAVDFAFSSAAGCRGTSARRASIGGARAGTVAAASSASGRRLRWSRRVRLAALSAVGPLRLLRDPRCDRALATASRSPTSAGRCACS